MATCTEVADLDPDDRLLVRPLAERGIEAVPAVWDDPSVEWDAFDLVVVRSTWDYAERYETFLAWVDGLRAVLNPAPVLRWSTDKRYLTELAARGTRVPSTTFLEPGEAFTTPAGRFVVKPAVSAGGRRSAAYEDEDGASAAEHVRKLHAEGRTVIVQPFLDAVAEQGEVGLVWIGGHYSHAFRKGPLLHAGQSPGTALYLEEDISPTPATPAELATAEVALVAMPFAIESLLYARVDLAPADGSPLVLELELAEPSLYLSCQEGSADRLADAIAASLAPVR